MNKCLYIIGVVLLSAWAVPSFAQVSNDNEDRVNKIDTRFASQDFVPGQVLVKFKDANRIEVRRAQGRFASTSVDKVTEVLQRYGADEMEQLLPNEKPGRQLRRAPIYNGDIIQERDLSQLYCVKLSAEHQHETMQIINELNALDEVEYAEPNYMAYIMVDDGCIASTYHSNPLVDQQWYLGAYGVKDLWDEPIINPERPVIAVIDTGVDTEHPDLKDNCIEGYDFVNNTSHVIDDNMHGTHVAGIAAACNNEIGIIGANPRALIMPIKVLDKEGRGDNATILRGVQYAVEHGAKILNLSLGGYGYSKAAADVYRNASLGAIIVAAAGNDGKCIYASHSGLLKHGIQPEPSFPAAYSFVLGVQAITQYGTYATFSNYDDDGPLFSCESSLNEPDGFNYELKAPGVNMLSTVPDGKYQELQGTSMASPLVAGAISALMMVKKYENQQQLWGDLLCTDNIWQAYQITERPANLELVRVMMRERKDFTDETEDAYSGYYEAHAGESVDIYPVVRCTLGEASNIKIKLHVADFEDPNAVQILTDEVDFGWHLDTFGKAVSKNPVSVKIPSDIADSRRIQLKLTMSCDEKEEIGSGVFTLITNNMETIHGLITEDMVLSPGHAYYVDDDLVVNTGVKLTIEPGTRIEFAPNKGLAAKGKLVANGTVDNPITFVPHQGNGLWNGVKTHSPQDVQYNRSLYMNNDSSLFTLVKTDITPISVNFRKTLYYSPWQSKPDKSFDMNDYIKKYISWWKDYRNDMTGMDKELTDPSFITPAALEMVRDWNDYCAQYPSEPIDDANLYSGISVALPSWEIYNDPIDTIAYCRIEGATMNLRDNYGAFTYPYMKDCIIKEGDYCALLMKGERTVVMENSGRDFHVYCYLSSKSYIKNQKHWNFVNNRNTIYSGSYRQQPQFSDLVESNYFNNPAVLYEDGKEYWLQTCADIPEIDHAEYPSYLGTSREDIVRSHVYEMGNPVCNTYGQIDLSNMRTTPVSEAHGIVWKVLVNGKDAQDEYEEMLPLGVGRHKFEVYFNRPMNKAVEPKISFGVREPYTQQGVNEDAAWNEEGTIYTAYKTITGTTKSDGICRVYVHGAEDNEFFECPDERYRFNVNVNAAGSMATGFAAEASVGRVNLTWDNSQNDMEDAMGYNVYRFNPEQTKIIPGHYDENWNWIEPIEIPDTIRINEKILDVDTSEYIDYDVIPNHTYYYLYKVLSTDLKEYDISNIVAATPLTATMGDANGSGEVDVADVVTTVNYVVGMKPEPFIFDAADMNIDQRIDVLDVIGIVQRVLYPNGSSTASVPKEMQAVYTIENGVLYVESPVALGGIQVQLSLDGRCEKSDVRTAQDLNGFEHASAWLTDEDYLLLAYSMNGKTLSAGKHALLYIGDADITQMRLGDVIGRPVNVIAGEGTTNIATMGSRVKIQEGIYDLQGRKLSPLTSHLSPLKKGVYIINGQKVVK